VSDFEVDSSEVHLCTIHWLDSSKAPTALHLMGYEAIVEARLYYLVTHGSEPVTHVVNMDAVSEITFEPIAGGAR
jgi:hypothetical protein